MHTWFLLKAARLNLTDTNLSSLKESLPGGWSETSMAIQHEIFGAFTIL